MNFWSIITVPFSILMNYIYATVGNYGMAIILFTIIIKLLLYPLSLKSQKSMIETQKVKPLLDEINRKYKNDKEKLQKETLKIYQEHKINPAGGCLPTLVQFPILFGLYYIIREPLKYMFHFSFDKIEKVWQIAFNGQNISTSLIDTVNSIKDGVSFLNGKEITTEFIYNNQIVIADLFNQKLGATMEVAGKVINTVDFSFFGLNLAVTPNVGMLNIYWLIPIVATALTYLTSVMTQKAQVTPAPAPGKDAAPDTAAQMTKSMMYMMPIMTLVFTFTLPSGLGLYWIISSVIQIIQQYFTNKQISNIREEEKIYNVKSGKNSKNG